jgi:DNA polymerase III sliding clamp (beta) subunit (PCNA family)
MKLTCTVGDILESVNKVWETTDAKNAVIASNIYLKGIYKANESWLYVYATDYSLQCLTKLEIELDEDFEAALSPDDLTRGISSLNHETEMTLSRANNESPMRVKAGTVNYKVPCLGDTKFHSLAMKALPVLVNPDVVAHPSVFVAGIRSVLAAVSNNTRLYGVIRSVEIKGKDSIIKFSGSDGQVAAVAELKCAPLAKEFKLCIDKGNIGTLLRLITMNPAGEMEVYPEGIYFKFPDTLLGFSKLIGSLPDLKEIIAKTPVVTSCMINKQVISDTAKRAALFASTSINESSIKITCGKEGLKFEVNDYEEDVPGSFNKDKSVKVNKSYLLNCIQSCHAETIEVCFTDSKVLIIKDLYKEEEVDLSAQYVIMGQQ